MKIAFHGAARTVTGSKHLLTLKNARPDDPVGRGLSAEDMELELIDFGLEELGESTGENGEDILVIRCGFTDFGNMQKALEDKGITPITAELEWIPSTTVPVNDAQAEDVSKLIEKLEQDEDVQKVFHNMG